MSLATHKNVLQRKHTFGTFGPPGAFSLVARQITMKKKEKILRKNTAISSKHEK